MSNSEAQEEKPTPNPSGAGSKIDSEEKADDATDAAKTSGEDAKANAADVGKASSEDAKANAADVGKASGESAKPAESQTSAERPGTVDEAAGAETNDAKSPRDRESSADPSDEPAEAKESQASDSEVKDASASKDAAPEPGESPEAPDDEQANPAKASSLDVFDALVKKAKPVPLSRAGSAPPPPPSSAARPPSAAPPPPSSLSRPPTPTPPASPRNEKPEPPAAEAKVEAPAEVEAEIEPESDERPSQPARRSSYPPGHKSVLAALGKREPDSTPPEGKRSSRPSPPPAGAVRRGLASSAPDGALDSTRPSRPLPPPSLPPRSSAPELDVAELVGDSASALTELADHALELEVSRPASAPPPPRPPPPRKTRSSATPGGMPVAKSVQTSLVSGKGLRLLLAAAALVVVGTSVGYALMPRLGTLVVSASGPNGRVLPSVEIFVDSVKRCASSPCRVEGLSDGVHIVEAKAPGHISMAGKAVKIDGGDEVPFDLELPTSDTAAASEAGTAKAPAAKTEKPSAETTPKSEEHASNEHAPATSIEDLEPMEHAAPAGGKAPPQPVNHTLAQKLAGQQPAAAAPAPQSPAKATGGTLNINSIPATSVVVDGLPVGRTPRMGLPVSPGPHTVVFIHPEFGRKVQRISVEAGQTATAAVRFP